MTLYMRSMYFEDCFSLFFLICFFDTVLVVNCASDPFSVVWNVISIMCSVCLTLSCGNNMGFMEAVSLGCTVLSVLGVQKPCE